MENLTIPIFNRLSVIWEIMPYYGPTHKVFLMLSTLWSATRSKLINNYDAFIYAMKGYWAWLSVEQQRDLRLLFLPNDLFEINILSKISEDISTFVEFISKINKSEGWHFDKHFMHRQIKIQNYIDINVWAIKQLFPHFDKMRSVRVWNKINSNKFLESVSQQFS